MHDVIVEGRLQAARVPAFRSRPPRGGPRYRYAADAVAGHRVAVADEHVAVVGDRRLNDGHRRLPGRELPQQRAVGRRDADGAGSSDHQDLRNAVQRDQMRGAVAAAAGRTEPPWRARRGVVRGETARDAHDHEAVEYDGRACDAPVRNCVLGIGRSIARPDDRARSGVERVDQPGRTHRVDTVVVDRRRRARTGSAFGFPEADRIAVLPHRLAGAQPVAGHHFIVAALLLRVHEIAPNGE